MNGCHFCVEPGNLKMCRGCARSYDQSRARDAGTIFDAMIWASQRSRSVIKHLLVKPKKLSSLVAFIKAADEVASFVDDTQRGEGGGEAAKALEVFRQKRAAVCKAWGRNP